MILRLAFAATVAFALSMTFCLVRPERLLAADTAAESKPRLLILGATSRSAAPTIEQGLAKGWEIIGLARRPERLTVSHENFKAVKGDVRDLASLEAAMTGNEVVVSFVGLRTPEDPTKEIGEVDLYSVLAKNVIQAMKNKGNRRLILTSSTGVEHRAMGDKPESASMTDMWRWNARYLYADMALMEEMVEESGLDYVILRPGFMVVEPAKGNLKIADGVPTPGARVITYEDFAAFTLEQVVSDDLTGKVVGVYSDIELRFGENVDFDAAVEEAQGAKE